MPTAAALISVVAGLAFVAGCGGGTPPSAPAAAPAATVTVVAVAAPAPPSTNASFWPLVAETRSAARNDTGRQSALLEQRLTQLPPAQIVAFGKMRAELDRRAYTYDLWAAAYVIEDGCSSDCFRDFRGYVISLGQAAYEAAIKDPDSLASVAENAEQGDWENADNVAPDAYSSVTSDDYPLDSSDLSGTPRGTPFDENDIASLKRRFPRLAARFR
jgi:hypothetical protein